MRFFRKITFVFKNQSHYIGSRGQGVKSRSDVIKESKGTSGSENNFKQFSYVQGKGELSETKKVACGDGDKHVKEKYALESEAQPEHENEVIGELEVTSKGKKSFEGIP